MKPLIIFIYCAFCIFSFTSLKPKENKSLAKISFVAKSDDAPKVGDNVNDLRGEKNYHFSVEQEFTRAGISNSTKNDVLAGRLCAFIYSPSMDNVCRYIVIYDCVTLQIFSVVQIS